MTRWPLPRRHLYPRRLSTPERRRHLSAMRADASPRLVVMLDTIHAENERREEAERPARAMSTRRRLHTLHWAGCFGGCRRIRRLARLCPAVGREELGPKFLGATPRRPAR